MCSRYDSLLYAVPSNPFQHDRHRFALRILKIGQAFENMYLVIFYPMIFFFKKSNDIVQRVVLKKKIKIDKIFFTDANRNSIQFHRGDIPCIRYFYTAVIHEWKKQFIFVMEKAYLGPVENSIKRPLLFTGN